MTQLGVAAVLALRGIGEDARMADLRAVLAAALANDPGRSASFRERIKHRERWAENLIAGDQELKDWDATQNEADRLVDEVVALAITSLLREHGADQVPFAAGEAMLTELAGRAGVPNLVLGQTQELEFTDHTRATVALRFPGSRIWELPFLAHEFGHYVTRQLKHREPAQVDRQPLVESRSMVVQTMGAAQPPNLSAEAHASELLADCLGTVACGPMLVLACLCLRIGGAVKAASSSSTHPSWRDRVAAMSETLNVLSDVTGRDRYRQQRITAVDPLAERVLGALPVLTPASRQAAQLTVKTVLDHREDLVYLDADAAIEVKKRLGGLEPSPPNGISVLAVVDGAWRWRLSQPPDRTKDGQVAALALDYCRQLSGLSLAEGAG